MQSCRDFIVLLKPENGEIWRYVNKNVEKTAIVDKLCGIGWEGFCTERK